MLEDDGTDRNHRSPSAVGNSSHSCFRNRQHSFMTLKEGGRTYSFEIAVQFSALAPRNCTVFGAS
jgi:hypothetical protein